MIAEKGTHEELLAKRGRYASMWEKQIRAERALDAAREAHLKAARALRRANMGGQKQSESSRTSYNSLNSTLVNKGLNSNSGGKSEECTSASSGSSSNSDAESTHTDEHSDDKRDTSEERLPGK
jgi:hypothetical protein